MKRILIFAIITIAMVQFSACHPADDTISNVMSSMTGFANKTESSMESMMSSKNTTQTFSSSTSNLLLEAAKKLDITNLKSDEEFLRLLFESVFDIIKDTKSEESLFFSDLTTIVPSLIDKLMKQLQAAFFNIFFGGFVSAGATAADVGLKIATALETGKLSAASDGIETAEKIVDTVASNIPSNGFTDQVKNLVNASLIGADGAVKAAKTLGTDGSQAISNLLNKLKMVNASTTPGDITSKIANLETAKLAAASQGIVSAQKIANKVAGTLPSNGITDVVKKIASTSLDGAKDGVKAAKNLEAEGAKAIGGVLNAFKFGK